MIVNSKCRNTPIRSGGLFWAFVAFISNVKLDAYSGKLLPLSVLFHCACP